MRAQLKLKSDNFLSPFIFESVEHLDRTFIFNPTLELMPYFDEAGQLYSIEYPNLEVDVYASTLDQLKLEFSEQIAFLWDNYALADDQELTGTAQRLKRNLLSALKEI
ncbi:MAG: hypothetical protein HQK74_09695 [Desulfamplus sp.]|nr:hypothetical protein [Desulfamplus sp.]